MKFIFLATHLNNGPIEPTIQPPAAPQSTNKRTALNANQQQQQQPFNVNNSSIGCASTIQVPVENGLDYRHGTSQQQSSGTHQQSSGTHQQSHPSQTSTIR